LRTNVRLFERLPPAKRAKLQDLVQVFLAEKRFEGCGGQHINDEVRVTIAAQACLLVLGVEPNFYFDGVKTILVYPDAFVVPKRHRAEGFLVEEEDELLGEAWHRGPIVLSWSEVLAGARGPTDGTNLVLHEFAHHLDGLDGSPDGTPPMGRTQRRQWEQVTDREFRKLATMSAKGRATLLDDYGATDRSEFFAVATECFFERPAALRRKHPELYALLVALYRQDPAEWSD
jgi:hypothetical protein